MPLERLPGRLALAGVEGAEATVCYRDPRDRARSGGRSSAPARRSDPDGGGPVRGQRLPRHHGAEALRAAPALPVRGDDGAERVARLRRHARAARPTRRSRTSPTTAWSISSSRTGRCATSSSRTSTRRRRRCCASCAAATRSPRTRRTRPRVRSGPASRSCSSRWTRRRSAPQPWTSDHLELFRRLNPSSYLVVPLRARDRSLGTISLGMGDSGRHFRSADVELATELADRAAVAVDNALLYEAGAVGRAADRGVARAARQPLRLLDGRARRLGSKPPLRARERRARPHQRRARGRAHRPHARRGRAGHRGAVRAHLPRGARDRRAARAVRGVGRVAQLAGRRPALADELLPDQDAGRRGGRDRRRDHGDHRPLPRRGGAARERASASARSPTAPRS